VGVFAVRNAQDALSSLELSVGETSCRRAVFPYWRAQPYGFARAPWASGRWIVAVDDDPDEAGPRETVLAAVDDGPWRFRPEVLAVGDGPLPEITADEHGHLWAIAPWQGALIVLSAPQ
jgi:hypothetical protein